MLVRALLVVLTILNLGVALWWAMQPPAPRTTPLPALPVGVATLQLVQPPFAVAPAQRSESPAASVTTAGDATLPVPSAPAVFAGTEKTVAAGAAAVPSPSAAAATEQAVATPAPAAPVCLSLGPYADRAAAEAALAAVPATQAHPHLRESTDSGTTTFRVLLPVIGGEDGLRVAAERIAAAGIRDYYPIRQGETGNAIALGQYRSREGAERRLVELARSGVNADLIPGSGRTHWWLDLRADSAAQAAMLRWHLGRVRQRPLDCATLR
ncbi:hypothetical protein [Xanthomonas albilineans]|uniref:hypothetical protein n=1 Tax=Xanthomonas albilineans TaxID=29447 RepID=UPI0005F30EAB|nr:hypothetical protein [Xanthomonas albilineans]PPU93854.1 hypothetical protein XalbCFBP2523_05300 [Xanthomonas albilineans]